MSDYIRPQVLTFEEFVQLPQAVQANQNTLIIGEHYALRRATNDTEKPLAAAGPYAGDALSLGYPSLPASSVVDQSFVKLFVETAMARFFTEPSGAVNSIVSESAGQGNRITTAARYAAILEHPSALGDFAAAGFYTGGANLPRVYAFYPQATFDLGAEAGVMEYETSDGQRGTFNVPANATVAEITVRGPDGIIFDYDNAVTMTAANYYTVRGASGAEFVISRKPGTADAYRTDDLDVHFTVGVAAASYDGSILDITSPGDNSESISDVLAAIQGLANYNDLLTKVDISEIVGGAGTVNETMIVESNGDTTLSLPDTAGFILREVVSLPILPADLVFATNDAAARTSSIPRDVRAGDYLEYTVTPASTGTPVTAITQVVAVEASPLSAAIDEPVAVLAANNLHGDDLSVGLAIVDAGGDNQSTFGTMTVKSLDPSNNYALPNLSTGVAYFDFTVTITATGVAGVALATVSRPDGYFDTNVRIVAGAADGSIYIGDNMFVEFTAGGGDGIFRIGDTYTNSVAIEALTGNVTFSVGGFYTGVVDTTYSIEVSQGGKFVSAPTVTDGIQVPADTTLAVDASGYSNTAVTEEYVLTCTSAGSIATAKFGLESRVLADNASNITFGAFDAPRTVGANGLKLTFSTTGAPAYAIGDSWVIRLDAYAPRVAISDTRNSDLRTSVAVTAGVDVPVGLNGVTINFPANSLDGLVVGTKIIVDVTAAADGPLDTLVLADPLPLDVVSAIDIDGLSTSDFDTFDLVGLIRSPALIEIAREHTTPGVFNFTVNGDTVEVSGDVVIEDPELGFIPLEFGALFVHYRALLSTFNGGISLVETLDDIISEIGTPTEDNPLALGVFLAKTNSTKGIYFGSVATVDLAGYTSLLAKAGQSDKVYVIVPLTDDEQVIDAVKTHCLSLSIEFTRKWRRTVAGPAIPETFNVVDGLATITADNRISATHWSKITFTEDEQILNTVVVGDTVQLNFGTDAWGNATHAEYIVNELESNRVLYLTVSTPAEVTLAAVAKVTHTSSDDEFAERVRATAESYNHERVAILPPLELGWGEEIVASFFGAAAVGGLMTSVAPQRPLSNSEITGINSATEAHARYTDDQLDTMASGGTLILAQDEQDGAVYIRHQLTTARQQGILAKTEISMLTNADSIAYQLTAALAPFAGTHNITPTLLVTIRNILADEMANLSGLTSIDLIGPQLIAEFSEVVSVIQHPTLKDRTVSRLKLGIPAPGNHHELHLEI